MKNVFLLTLLVLFSCASQGSPSGGPVDKEGPVILEFSDEVIGSTDSIVISFNEIIKPTSAIQAITVNGNKDFKIQIRYNKIFIRPLDEWPNIVELSINRNVEDYQGNIMDAPINKIFRTSTAKIERGIIRGKLINISDEDIYEVGLYRIQEDSLLFIKRVQASKEGNFQIQNIGSGDYRVCAIEGILNDFNKDYRFSKYGLQSDKIFINSSNYEFDIKIIVDEPISKNQIIAADMINSNYSILTLSDGSEKPIYLESDRTSGQYLDGDSISVSLYNENRFGKYLMDPFSFSAQISKDTIPANLDKYYTDNNMLFINFSEPVKLLKDDIFFDSDSSIVDYNIVDPFRFSINLENSRLNKININGNFISDFNNNLSDSLITINVPKTENDLLQKFGSLMGKIDYNSDEAIVVRLTSVDSDKKYHTLVDENSNFIFDEVLPGIYTLDSYENRLLDITTYYSGEWEPFGYAAKFSIYPETIDIRAHWIIEGIEINYD